MILKLVRPHVIQLSVRLFAELEEAEMLAIMTLIAILPVTTLILLNALSVEEEQPAVLWLAIFAVIPGLAEEGQEAVTRKINAYLAGAGLRALLQTNVLRDYFT